MGIFMIYKISPCPSFPKRGIREELFPIIQPFMVTLVSLLIMSGVTFIHCVYASDEFAEKYRAYKNYVQSGSAAFQKKDYASAIDNYSKAIEMSPFEVTSYYNRGIAYYKSGKEKEAKVDFNKVIILDPRSSSAYVYRGLCKVKGGDYQGALNDYKRALELNPKDPSIHNNLAWLYAKAKDEKFQDKIKALEHAVKAAELTNEKNAEVLDTLASAYFSNGKVAEAVETEKKALKLEPGNIVFKENLKRYEES